MSAAFEQSRKRTVFMIATGTGEKYTYHYGHSPIDRMCALTYHKIDGQAELIGSSVPLAPLEVGRSALLGVDTQLKDQYVLETSVITHIGPAPDELQPGF